MYSSENITKILDLRFEEPESYEYTGNRPSDELIVKALDLVRFFIKVTEPKIYLGVDGIETVVRFTWDIKNYGFVQCTLSENKVNFYATDYRNADEQNGVLDEEDFELDCNENETYYHISYLVEKYIRIIHQNNERT